MVEGYYDRKRSTWLDGSLVFQTAQDIENQNKIGRAVERAWGPGVEVCRFPDLSLIDQYVCFNGRINYYMESKWRSHSVDDYETVWLASKKHLALFCAVISGLAERGMFMARFIEGVRWIDVMDIDATKQRIGGSKHKKEPVIDVPVQDMHPVRQRPDGTFALHPAPLYRDQRTTS